MSTTQIQPGGSPAPALATVATDQETIFGSGTEYDPLTTNGGSGSSGRTLQAQLNTVGGDHIGQPVTISSASITAGVTAITKATSTSTQQAAIVAGLMTTLVGSGGTATVQTDGIVTLTEAEWDTIAGTSGGLTNGDTYYLDTAGLLSSAPNGTSGQWSVQVGLGLSRTQMLLSTPSVPLLNP